MAKPRAHRLVNSLRRPERFKRLKRKVTTVFTLDLNRSFESLIFVAGTGRSGTTWLLELLNADNRHRVIFEPFRPQWGALGSRELPVYLRPGTNDPEFEDVVQDVLLGRLRSNRLTGRGNERLVSTSRIVKDVDSNLKLGWLRARFPPFPIVYIIRHPCAVAASRKRLGNDVPLNAFLEDGPLVEDYLHPFADTLVSLATPFEHAVAAWCIENYVPLRQIEEEGLDVTTVLYEDLVANPAVVLRDIFKGLQRELPTEALENVGRLSLTAWRTDAPLPAAAHSLGDWQQRLTDDEIETARALVKTFQLDRLYGPEHWPEARAGLAG
jgi:hypothetical protein